MPDLSSLSDDQLKAIADGKMDTLPDDVLQKIAGVSPASPAPQESGSVGYIDPKAPADPRNFYPASAGLMAGLPVSGGVPGTRQVMTTIKNMGLEGGGGALGQTVGAPFGPAGMAVGGAGGSFLGNIAGQLTTKDKPFSFGEAVGAGVSGAVPGAPLAKAGVKEVVKLGAKQAGASLAGAVAQYEIEGKGIPSVAQMALSAGLGALSAPLAKFMDRGSRAEAARIARQQDSMRRETLKSGQALGLVVPPSVTNPNAVNNTMNSLAGKAAAAQEATLRNQPKINDAVAKEIYGDFYVSLDAPLSPIALNTARTGPNLVYDRISKTSQEAAGLLSSFKQSMADANELYATYRSMPIKDPSVLAAAKAAETQADVFKNGLAKIVHPDLMSEFDQARTQLAKIGMAERALNVGDGNIDAKIIGQALDHGEKLTGAFRTIGRFQNAFGKYVQEAAKTPPSGVDYLKAFTKLGVGGGLGYQAGGVPGAIAGSAAMMGAESGARNLVLSPFYQRQFAQPYYGPVTADSFAEIVRRATATPQTN